MNEDVRVFIISDTHFFHTNIIKYCNRPFKSMEEMNKIMVRNWNKTIRQDDIVFHVGDFSLTHKDESLELLASLNGNKVLIRGNHDDKRIVESDVWQNVVKYFEFEYYDVKVHLSHYPHKNIVKRENLVYIHGHRHSINGVYHDGQIDASVDGWDFKPVLLDDMLDLHLERISQCSENCQSNI